MFVMTGNVTFVDSDNNKLKGKFHSLTWANSIDNYCNTAEIILPGIVRVKGLQDIHSALPFKNERGLSATSLIIKRGMKVNFECGYNGKNIKRFSGFVALTSVKNKRLAVSCEGYSYLLRQKIFTEGKSFHNGFLIDILKYITTGTEIKLSKDILNVQLMGNIPIQKGKRAIDVIEYLKEECLMTLWFNNDELYAGLKYIQKGNDIRCRINWNVINADSLVYNEYEPYKTEIESSKKKDGSKTIVTSGNGTTLRLKIRHIKDESVLKQIAIDQDKNHNLGRHSGTLEMFLMPFIKPTDTLSIEDKNFPERKGKYFVDEVEGSFSTSGGRQKVKISLKLP